MGQSASSSGSRVPAEASELDELFGCQELHLGSSKDKSSLSILCGTLLAAAVSGSRSAALACIDGVRCLLLVATTVTSPLQNLTPLILKPFRFLHNGSLCTHDDQLELRRSAEGYG